MSVAVLDFENLSRDTSDAWLGQGIAGELTSRLGRVGRLVVASRAAVRRVANPGTMRLPELGRALNAAYLVNGSVQRSGPRLRITVELSRAATGAQVWTNQFDRSESDLLVVQESVATAVATAVTGTLLPAEATTLATRPTRNPEAYAAYLHARALVSFAGTTTRIPEGVALLERAVAIDSTFADAWAELAQAHVQLYWNYQDRTARRVELARIAADRAKTLAPDAATTHIAQGYYYYWGRRDYAHALQEFSAALVLEPNNASVHGALANVARRQGSWDRSLVSRTRAVTLDPSASVDFFERGNTLGYMRRFDEGERDLARARELEPETAGDPYALSFFVNRDGSVRNVPDRAAAVASNTGALAFSLMKDPGIVAPLWRVSEEIQAAILTSAPPTDTLSRAGWFLMVGQVLALKGRPAEAAPVFDSARALLTTLVEQRPYDDGLHSGLSLAYAGLGSCDDAVREGERAAELLTVDDDALAGIQHILTLAEIEAKCGRWDQAAVRIEFALSRPGPITRTLLRLDPVWTPLHGTTRYERLVAGH